MTDKVYLGSLYLQQTKVYKAAVKGKKGTGQYSS